MRNVLPYKLIPNTQSKHEIQCSVEALHGVLKFGGMCFEGGARDVMMAELPPEVRDVIYEIQRLRARFLIVPRRLRCNGRVIRAS